jgi:hypothetical protein
MLARNQPGRGGASDGDCLKVLNCPHQHCIFAASNLFGSN